MKKITFPQSPFGRFTYLIAMFGVLAVLGLGVPGCGQSTSAQNQAGTVQGNDIQNGDADAGPQISTRASAFGQDLVATVQAKSPGNAPRTIVVLVAVQDYMREEKPLRFTKSDAFKFANELIRYGVVQESNVILLTTGDVPSAMLATKDNIEEKIGKVLSEAKEGDTVIIYMGGHGAEYNGIPYFAPLNAGNSVATQVSVGEIVEAFGHSKAAFKLMIIDACRSGNTSGAFAALKPSQGVMLLQSSESGESSLEVDGVIGGEVLQGGLFSIALQEGLQGKGVDASGNITLLSLAAYAMKRTPVLAALLGEKQTPHMQGNLTDIVLVPKDKVGAGATAIAGGTPPSGNMDEARKRREDAVKEARTTIDVAIQRLIAAELEKVEKANQNPNLNPFDNSDLDQKIAKTILELIQGSRNLEIVLSQATAKYEMEELVRELITIPVQTALKDARTQWEKELIARQEREEEEKRVMAEAVKESLSDITKISQPDDIYAFAKDKNILARKDSVGNHEFGVKGVWLGENALGKDIYDKLKKVGKYLEAGVDPTRYDELEKKARSILNTPANAEIYCVKTPGGDYKYTPEQRNAAAVQMMRDAYGDGRLLKDENGVKRFKPSKEVLDEFEQMLAVLKIEYQGKREVDKTVVNAMLKENKKLVEDKYLISDDELKDKEKQVDNDISGKSNQVMTDFYIKLKTDYGREVVEQCAKEVIDDLKNANIPGFSEERATKYERFYMKLSSKLLLIGKENPYYGAVINNNFLNKGTAL